MTEASGIDYAAVLADLEQRRDALNIAIEAIRPLAEGSGEPSVVAPPRGPRLRAEGTVIRGDEFFGMSILQAAKRFLALQKAPQTAPDIAKALKAHGLLNTNVNFANTVYSVLYRESARGGRTVVKVGNSWGLSEWYPNRPKPPTKGKAQTAAPNGDASEPTAADDEAPE